MNILHLQFLPILTKKARKTNLTHAFSLILISTVILFLQQFPNYFAYLQTPTGYFYSGQASWFDPWDINVYVAAIRYGQEQSILLQNLYSTTENGEAFIYPLYTVAGSLFPINPYLLFHLLASLGSITLLTGIYYFCLRLTNSKLDSALVTILSALGGGFGWLVDGWLRGADLYTTSFTLASSFQRGHEAIGTLLYFSAMIFYFLSLQYKSKKYLISSVTTILLLTFFYPYYGLIYAVVCGISTVLHLQESHRYKNFGLALLGGIFLASICSLTYFYHLHSSGFSSAASEQLPNVTITKLVIGYGVFLLILIPSYFLKKKPLPRFTRFLLIWIIVSLIASFAPVGFSRFFLRGLFFPITLLTITLLRNITFRAMAQMLLMTLVMFLPLSRVYVFYKRVSETTNNNRWYYLSEGVKEGFDYVAQRKRDGILTFYTLGNYVPAQTGKSVFFGHLLQTPDADEKIKEINRFYSGELSNSEALSFLGENNISFIVYGKDERLIGGHVYDFMKLSYENDAIRILEY